MVPAQLRIRDQLAALERSPFRVAVVIDPEGLVDPADARAFGEAIEVRDWYGLRRAYERLGRRRPETETRLVIVVRDPATRTATSLPQDIGRATAIVLIRPPVPREWLPVWRDLPEGQRDQLSAALSTPVKDSLAAVLGALYGVSLPEGDEAVELDSILRLRARGDVPSGVWRRVHDLVRGTLASGLSLEPPDIEALQTAWYDWLATGSASQYQHLFAGARPGLSAMLSSGLLKGGVRSAPDLPPWTMAGDARASGAEVAQALLAVGPPFERPQNLDDWIAVAYWWADVRSALTRVAPADPSLAEAAWTRWGRLDEEFGRWLDREYGSLMTSSPGRVTAVHRIAPFLARRLRAETERVLLIVMDGMGLSQWTQMRQQLGLRVLEPGACLAMIPTLTQISRQAIFAGALPLAFPETIGTTARERDRWFAFWAEEGVRARDVGYLHTAGASLADIPMLGTKRVVGMVVLAVDELMHGSELLADAQMAAGVENWLAHGFMRGLLSVALDEGFEVWVTADHGNLPALPAGKVEEGLGVESAGRRARLYASPSLRAASRVDGIEWDSPVLPSSGPFPLFAPGRTAYISGHPQVVHGGRSFDEVLVPMMRVGR